MLLHVAELKRMTTFVRDFEEQPSMIPSLDDVRARHALIAKAKPTAKRKGRKPKSSVNESKEAQVISDEAIAKQLSLQQCEFSERQYTKRIRIM